MSTAKTPADSRVSLGQLMGIDSSNTLGNVHGGHIMKMMDEAGAAAAIRHAGHKVVTVAVDQMVFHEPIRLGDLVTVAAELTWAGRTSMEAELTVTAVNLLTGKTTHTNTAYFVYVAIDRDGHPVPVPALELTSDAERARWEEAMARRQRRLAGK